MYKHFLFKNNKENQKNDDSFPIFPRYCCNKRFSVG